MATKKRVPEIRFQGFSGEWRKQKLGNIGETFTGLSGKTKADFGHGDGRFITYMNVFSNPVVNPNMVEPVEIDNKQAAVKSGDVLFTTSSETPEEVGMSSVMLHDCENTYLNSFCFGYRPQGIFNNNFLAYMLRSDIVRRDIVFLAQGISRYNISKNKVMEISVPIPEIPEQSQIGSFFQNLDSQITLHQGKLSKLGAVKKSMLEKMFPKEGAAVPEIRFQGFEGKWERKTLGEMCDEFQSGKFIRAADIKNEGIYPVFGGNGLRGYSDTFNHDGTFALIGRQGALCGNLNISYGKAYFTEHAVAVCANASNSTGFLFYLLGLMNLGQYSSQSAQPGLAVTKLIELSVHSPEKSEQSQIAAFFQNLDSLISLQQRELDKLKNIKKACLAKMFV